jgi:hypothetical protein
VRVVGRGWWGEGVSFFGVIRINPVRESQQSLRREETLWIFVIGIAGAMAMKMVHILNAKRCGNCELLDRVV